MNTRNHSRKKLCLLLLVSILVTSCGSRKVKLAKKFSEVSTAFNTLNEQVSGDIYNSCTRSATWRARGDSGSRITMRKDIQDCDSLFRPNSVKANTAGLLLVEYLNAIGRLSTENRETVKTRFEEIGTSLKEISIDSGNSTFSLEQNTIDTGVKLGTFLTNLLLTNFRKKHLRDAIICTDDDIQSYSKDLAKFYEELYVKSLLDEEVEAITGHFNKFPSALEVDSIFMNLRNDSPIDFTEVQSKQMEREKSLRGEIQKVITQKNSGASYVKIIRTTAASHADLKKVFNDGEDEISEKQKKRCQEYFETDTENNQTEGEQESNNAEDSLTYDEIIKIEKIANKYIEKVEPILQDLKLSRNIH